MIELASSTPPLGGLRVLLRLFLLFIVVPFVELVLLLRLAQATSPAATLALVIVTGIIGTLLARSQGFRTYQEIQRALAEGRVPTDSLIDGVLIFIAGAVLLTPGILTDLCGFTLLIPFTRRYVRIWLVKRFKKHFKMDTAFAKDTTQPGSSEVIDSYVIENHSEQ